MKEPVLFKNHPPLQSPHGDQVRSTSDATSDTSSDATLSKAVDTFRVSANDRKSRVKYWTELSAKVSSASTPEFTPEFIPEFTEVHLHAQENSKLEYVFFQNLPESVEAIARIKITADRNAQVQFTVIQQGARRASLDVVAECLGEGADIQIRGLQNARGSQKFAINVHAVHSVPRTRSDLVVWCVARDQSQSIFNALVTIEKHAHHTEAFQKNKNLLLSDKATIDTFPKLFIANDEVKCAHGSSTSTLDPEQFIYLQSRGIQESDAERMLTSGFINQALEWISDSTEKKKLTKTLNVNEEEVWDE